MSEVSDAFTQQVGRAPTDAELAAYEGAKANGQDWQTQLKDNIAAPNGYSNFLQYGDVNGAPKPTPTSSAPGEVPGYGIAPNPYANAASAPTYAAPNLTNSTTYAPPPAFVAPTTDQILNSPGVQVGARLAQQGKESSAAAKGSVLSGGFQKELAQYLQDYGTTKSGDVLAQDQSTYGLNAQTQLGAFGAGLAGNAQQLASADQTFRNQNTTFQGQNNADQTAYGMNYMTSHNAANDYYNALLDQEHLGAQTGAATVTA